MGKTKTEFVVARHGFAVPQDGTSRLRVIKGGEVLAANDPIVKSHSHLFEDVGEVVERATAGPGELRAVTPKKKAADGIDS